ncbi:MAG: aminodeoxychorismate synthase component I [Myxococcales bacterium]|nr:MAG: aminodeoxychorismate synthase component I [Myxococcales bacterium]
MRCLIIDNYDSFTWNLADYVSQSFGTPPVVVRNDEYTWRGLLALDQFGCIIVSPGPGSVDNPADFNVSKDALEQTERPVLGVCLGHQGLAHIYGARIQRARVPFHGRQSAIHHDGSELFAGLPPVFQAVRYHSLVVDPSTVPSELQVTARTECGLVMGLRHRTQPKWGVQFHPESILTLDGMRIIQNFRDEAHRFGRRSSSYPAPAAWKAAESDFMGAPPALAPSSAAKPKAFRSFSRRIPGNFDPESVFAGLFGNKKYSVWLDGHAPGNANARFSFMGSPNQDAVLVYRASEGVAAGARHLSALDQELKKVVHDGESLPFEFRGGYVGYMSYEMKAAFGAPTTHLNAMPDSAWMLLERFIAFDHESRELWLVAVAEPEHEQAVQAWMDDLACAIGAQPTSSPAVQPRNLKSLSVSMDFDRAAYLRAIEHCKQKIAAGESYEVCLTNIFTADVQLDPLDLYRTMRKGNAAPYSAFIRLGQHAVLSTSPERFLRVDARGTIQTKPIKGTSARSEDAGEDARSAELLASSEKDRAENLMIVDLMRNDLSRVSESGSVNVPKLMDIESFKTVHQMVSTVESKLRAGHSLVDLLGAVFPGGSITGAPKIRTMEILNELERSPRGVYCGSIGYLGYNRVADLNIAIRTVSYDGSAIKFGAGGAITYLSQPDSEFDEVLLKAEAVLRPVWQHVGRAQRFESVVRGQTLHIEVASPDGSVAQEAGTAAVACNV